MCFEIFGPVAFVVFVVFVATAFVVVVVVMSAGNGGACCLVQTSSHRQRIAQPSSSESWTDWCRAQMPNRSLSQ